MARDDLPATGCVSPRTVEDGLSVPPHSGRLFASGCTLLFDLLDKPGDRCRTRQRRPD